MKKNEFLRRFLTDAKFLWTYSWRAFWLNEWLVMEHPFKNEKVLWREGIAYVDIRGLLEVSSPLTGNSLLSAFILLAASIPTQLIHELTFEAICFWLPQKWLACLKMIAKIWSIYSHIINLWHLAIKYSEIKVFMIKWDKNYIMLMT